MNTKTRRAAGPKREVLGAPMVRKTSVYTEEMMRLLETAAKRNKTNFSWEVREAIGQRFNIPAVRRHGGEA